MLLKNTREQFGYITIAIHWLVALTVYALFALGAMDGDLGLLRWLVSPGTRNT